MPLFHIIRLDTGAIAEIDGVPITAVCGSDAAERARIAGTTLGVKCQPRLVPVPSDEWHAREEQRLISTYTALPWDGFARLLIPESAAARVLPHEEYTHRRQYWFYCRRKPSARHHYPHVSQKVPGNIAFTESAEKGVQDIQTSMLPGRYLTRYYDLPPGQICELAAEFAASHGMHQLNFAHTADEIEHVYLNGPSSCMSHPVSHFWSSVHPARVYGGYGLAVAYLSVTDEMGSDRIVARTVCWPLKKVYSRVYGDETKLTKFLYAEGYKRGSLAGAELQKIIDDGGRFVMPYLDEDYGVDDYEDHFVITDEAPTYPCQTTNGIIGNRRPTYCAHCGDTIHGEAVAVGEEDWCENCADSDTFYCMQCEYQITDGEPHTMHSGQLWCGPCFEQHGGICDATGENYHMSGLVPMYDGEFWSLAHFRLHGRECAECGDRVPNDYPCCEVCESQTREEEAA